MSTPVFDPFQRPVNPLALKYDVARPSSRSGARKVQTHYHPAENADPEALAYWMFLAEAGDPLFKLEYMLEMPERDPAYKMAIEQRVLLSANAPRNVRPASTDQVDQDAAKAFEDVLAQPGIANAWARVLQAIPLGFSVSWIEWTEKIRSTNPKRMLWPKSLKLKPPTWFRFDPNDMREPYLRGEGGALVPLPGGMYFTHFHEGMSTIPIRGGISSLCAWLYMFKKYAEKDIVNFNENYLIPWMIGTLGPGQSPEDPAGQIMVQAMEAIGNDMRALLTEGQNLKVLEVNKPNTIGPFISFLDYVDKSYARAALGQNQTTDTTGLPHGAGKAISAKQTMTETIVASDSRLLNEDVRSFLAIPFTQYNWGRRPEYMRIDSDTSAQGEPQDAERAMKIAAQVRSGEVTRESGKTGLQIFFHLDADQADALLGAPTLGAPGDAGKPPAGSLLPAPAAVAPAGEAAAKPTEPAAPGVGQVPVTDPLATLNGAQIEQARGIVADFNAGVLSRDQALAQLKTLLNLEDPVAAKMLGAGPIPPPPGFKPPGGPPPAPPAANSARAVLSQLVDRVGLDRLLDRIARGLRE